MTLNLTRLQDRIAFYDDQESYRELFMHFFPKLRTFVRSILGSIETAEEIASDTLLQVWLKRKTLSQIENLTAWLFVAARNRALNYLEKPTVSSILSLDLPDMEVTFTAADPEQELILREDEIRITQAINQLPPKCRLIFRMIREEGLRYKEVAEILNISVNTIDAQMAIAVKRIMKHVGLAKSASGSPGRIIRLR